MSLLHVEKLQIGCPKLKVLRVTNSQIWMAPASRAEQVIDIKFIYFNIDTEKKSLQKQ